MAEFECLLPAFQVAYAHQYPPDLTYEGKARQRGAGGGATGTLPSFADNLFCILVYQKTHPLPVMHGLPCAWSHAPANAWMPRLLPVLQHALRAMGQAPERDAPRVEASAWAFAGAPNLAVDGTERRRQRPRDTATPKEQDSGKQKTPTDKHILLVNEHTRQVVSLGPTLPGQTHDKKAVDEAPVADRPPTTLDKDTGCQGDEPEGVVTTQPQKSPQAKSSRGVTRSAPPSSPGCGWWSHT